MSCNKYESHVLVLPEDDANGDVATGFHLQVDGDRQRRMQVLPVAGGWEKVVELFLSEHVVEMDRWPRRLMILLIDCDGHQDRLSGVKAQIPKHLADRVFVLGALTEPESLKAALGALETIGARMAKDCRDGTNTVWDHSLLRHNADEVQRMNLHVRPLFFPE